MLVVFKRSTYKQDCYTSLNHVTVCDSTLTQLCFLHEDLSEGPADPADKGGQQHHAEALQVELGGLKSKHEQTAGDQQDHHDQEWVLKERDKERR